MTVATIDFGSASAAGLDVDSFSESGIDIANATATGFPVLAHRAIPAPSDTPDALRLEILTSDGTQLVNDFTKRRNLTFSVEHNGSGSITFETDLAAFADGIEDALLDPSNLVRVHFGDMAQWPDGVAEGFITSAPPTKNDDGSWSLSVACPGAWDVLDFGVLWPTSGAFGNVREFSYTAGLTGPSWVPAQWGTPVGKNVKESFRWRDHRWPSGWPESKSEWLWTSNPDKSQALNTIEGSLLALGVGITEQFVGSFTTTETNTFRFYVAGDDTLRFYLNGSKAKDKPKGAWHKTTSFTRTLPPGTHTVAASVTKLNSSPAGFLCAVARLNNKGDIGAWVLRSKPSTFKVKKAEGFFAQVPLPPDGWYPAAVLHVHLAEAAARGVDFHSDITPTFTTTTDSDGTAWATKGPVEYELGLSGAQLGEKIRAGGVDVAMLPGLKLAAWRQRGFDLRDQVKISKPLGVRWTSRAWPRVRTVALTHHEAGWKETTGDAGLLAEYGRRELPLSGGGVNGHAQADVFAASAMTTAASPEETIEVDVTSADLRDGAPQPFRDFNVADTITVETVGGFQAIKVMTIAGAEQDAKEVRFTIAGYPV